MKVKRLINKSQIEYLAYGLNWWTGCAHNCRYCYMRALAQRFARGETPGKWGEPVPCIVNPHVALEQELTRRRAALKGMLMLCTSHDPAMSKFVALQMHDIVKVLCTHDLAPQTLVLTKSPQRALNALGRLGADDGLRFGVSLTSLESAAMQYYEPHAEFDNRLRGITRAAASGYKTWVSIEPPLPQARLSDLVSAVLKTHLRPWIVLGKMNHGGSVVLFRDWASAPLWGEELAQSLRILHTAGYKESLVPQDGGYWIKHELRRLLPA